MTLHWQPEGRDQEISAGILRVQNCEKHGEYDATLVFPGKPQERWTGCPSCRQEQWDQERLQREEVERKARLESMFANCGIPPKFGHAVPKVEGVQELRWMEKVLSQKSTGPLILSGTVGAGKSHKACEMLLSWIKTCEKAGRYVTAAEYCRLSRSTWNNRGEFTESQIMSRYAASGFLVLDDMGAGKAADAELIQDLICERYDKGFLGLTIVSTNIAAPAFDEKFGERVADRLREGATLVEMTGASMRKPAQ